MPRIAQLILNPQSCYTKLYCQAIAFCKPALCFIVIIRMLQSGWEKYLDSRIGHHSVLVPCDKVCMILSLEVLVRIIVFPTTFFQTCSEYCFSTCRWFRLKRMFCIKILMIIFKSKALASFIPLYHKIIAITMKWLHLC